MAWSLSDQVRGLQSFLGLSANPKGLWFPVCVFNRVSVETGFDGPASDIQDSGSAASKGCVAPPGPCRSSVAEAGYRVAELSVDSESPTGAGKIYQRHGFEVLDRHRAVGKDLP